jgi:hypothetical protein
VPFFPPTDVQDGAAERDLVPTKTHQLRRPQPMPERHQDQRQPSLQQAPASHLAGTAHGHVSQTQDGDVEKHPPALKARITTAVRQELKSKRLAHQSIQIPSSNYRARGAMHWR